MNVLGWKSKRSERRAWSTLAAETHVLQHALDKSIHIHEVLKQLKQPIVKATVVTDNLSLRRCLYSGRPTKEERLRKEFAVIRDLKGTESKHVRFVTGDHMPADCLTKKVVKENSLVKMIRTNSFPTILFFDDDVVTEEQMAQAEELIEMQCSTQPRRRYCVPLELGEQESAYVNKVLHGRGAEFEQLRMMHNIDY